MKGLLWGLAGLAVGYWLGQKGVAATTSTISPSAVQAVALPSGASLVLSTPSGNVYVENGQYYLGKSGSSLAVPLTVSNVLALVAQGQVL